MRLNQEQAEAVRHHTGPMLVLAGPGSGKTAVITARTNALIEQQKAAPSSILVVTFTKAAAGEMKERFLSSNGGRYRQVHFGTFHGIFYGILKQAYGINSSNIIGDDQRRQILRELLEHSGQEPEEEKDLLELLEREISMVKNEQFSLEHYYSGCCPEQVFRDIYKGYQRELRQRGLLDFDDLQSACYELFVKRPDILKRWQQVFQYIQVDEFQDINRLQYRIIRMLAAPENNLFVVGDDDQSIYRFRGAHPEMMQSFLKDYPGSGRVILKQNYRCTGAIVSCSQRLVRHNMKRFEKDLKTENPQGESVEVHPFSTVDNETTYLVKCIQDHLKEGCSPEEIAVLFRTNTGSRQTVTKFLEYNLPFTMKDRLPNLYEHWIAKQILSYLRISKGGRDRNDFLQIINRPNRYISRNALYEKKVSFDHLYQFYEDKEWMCDRIETLEHDMRALAGMTPFAAINYIRCGIGYNVYLREYANERGIREEELTELLDEIQESSRNYRTFEEWERFIADYTRVLQQSGGQKKEEGIVISTLHGTKGLEYRHVYIMDISEGMIPYQKAVLPEEIEEERRLLYVGMTRAKETLHLFYSQKQYEKRREPSRFLQEILGES